MEERLLKTGGVAQLGERLPCKQEASGSIPLISTTTDCAGARRVLAFLETEKRGRVRAKEQNGKKERKTPQKEGER